MVERQDTSSDLGRLGSRTRGFLDVIADGVADGLTQRAIMDRIKTESLATEGKSQGIRKIELSAAIRFINNEPVQRSPDPRFINRGKSLDTSRFAPLVGSTSLKAFTHHIEVKDADGKTVRFISIVSDEALSDDELFADAADIIEDLYGESGEFTFINAGGIFNPELL